MHGQGMRWFSNDRIRWFVIRENHRIPLIMHYAYMHAHRGGCSVGGGEGWAYDWLPPIYLADDIDACHPSIHLPRTIASRAISYIYTYHATWHVLHTLLSRLCRCSELMNNQIGGTIPAELGQLKQLREL